MIIHFDYQVNCVLISYSKNVFTCTGANPQQIFTCQQCCDSQTGSFVLSYDCIGTWMERKKIDNRLEVRGETAVRMKGVIPYVSLTCKHLMHSRCHIHLCQALQRLSVVQFDQGTTLQRQPNTLTVRHHAGHTPTAVCAHLEPVLRTREEMSHTLLTDCRHLLSCTQILIFFHLPLVPV